MNTWLLLMIFFLVGCSPTDVSSPSDIGIKQSAWDKMSDSEHASAMSSYYANSLKRRSLMGGAIASNQQLHVSISGGRAAIGPELVVQAYKPASAVLNARTRCVNLPLYSRENVNDYTNLSLCLDDKNLYIDASAQDKAYALGSVNVPVNNILKQGASFCHLTTTGTSALHDACLSLRLIDPAFNNTNTPAVWQLTKASKDDRYLEHVQVETMKN